MAECCSMIIQYNTPIHISPMKPALSEKITENKNNPTKISEGIPRTAVKILLNRVVKYLSLFINLLLTIVLFNSVEL